MLLQGNWFRKGSAAQYKATLRAANRSFTIEAEEGHSYTGNLEDLKVSDRLGNVERKLTLEDGSVFTTRNNDSVDILFKRQSHFSHIIYTLERGPGWAAFALMVTITLLVAFFKWGVPWASHAIAHALPHKTNELISQGSLNFLDKYVFEESKIDSQRQEEIRAGFLSNLTKLESKSSFINYKLHFREWGEEEEGIPNAFALPSGDIILTDKFIELSKNQNEIDSILLHEMGHVANKHSLEMVIEGALITAVVTMVTGDNSAIVDMGLGVGSLVVSSSYSRKKESEADEYAFRKMLKSRINPEAFTKIMTRMTVYMENTVSDSLEHKEDHNKDKGLFDYLSSHPNTAARIQEAGKYADCFKKELAVCEL